LLSRLASAWVFVAVATALPAATCVPSQLVVAFTNTPTASTASFPISLRVRVADDCGNYVNQGTVVATFSNGDLPLAFSPIGNGLWVATYQIRNSAGSITIAVRAQTTAPALTGAANLTITPVQAPNFAIVGAENIPPAVAGGEPVRQKVTITSSNGQVPFQVTAPIVGGQLGLLSVEPSSGVTPAIVELVYSPHRFRYS
jgi:hypothetical protein